MPELPEVEIIARGLANRIIGETVAQVHIMREQSVGYPGAARFAQSLKGWTFVDVKRRGKYLLLALEKEGTKEEAYLVVHLRMSGRLLLLQEKEAKKKEFRFLRAAIHLRSGCILYFEDMRVFGRLCFVTKAKDLGKVSPSFSKLGFEPLHDLSADKLLSIFQHRRQAIKTALLDQTLIAGIGNIYADEILFQAGLHPLTPALKISPKKAKLLAQIIPETLERAIARGGSSIKDFVDSEGVNGNYQDESFVYGRLAQPCRKCKVAIKRLKIGGRSSHFCPKCQKKQ